METEIENLKAENKALKIENAKLKVGLNSKICQRIIQNKEEKMKGRSSLA
ncbi:MAG: hypothetical protein sL5_09740 [Candidatus Mesenet longicola]|uniref:Transposase n=1 Tax=Candidatus Mesenet longicola TaxID=1892558 RepID=A0A8J3HXA7_9RICK|nr:MAG: hypothetical protein sGL2_10230 [Candidatus Mesenet longicola]GHM59981.1 MAG: hypothetical protein sL5_09740 [Candidatus Mesenet longicola]